MYKAKWYKWMIEQRNYPKYQLLHEHIFEGKDPQWCKKKGANIRDVEPLEKDINTPRSKKRSEQAG